MSAPHLDDRVLASLQEVMEDEYPVLLDTFVLDSEERLRSLHAALQAGDAQALRHTAHSFERGSSNMGAVLLAGYCKELEESARRGDLQRAPALIEQMEREFAIVRILSNRNVSAIAEVFVLSGDKVPARSSLPGV